MHFVAECHLLTIAKPEGECTHKLYVEDINSFHGKEKIRGAQSSRIQFADILKLH
jgi:hypothetical protein